MESIKKILVLFEILLLFVCLIVIFIVFVVIFVVLSPLFSYLHLKEVLSNSLVGSILVVSGAFLTACIAWIKLDEIKNTNSADFIHRLKNDFFKAESRNLITLINLNAIKFIKKGKIQYFEVVKEGLENFPEDIRNQLTQKKFYTTYEIDDLLWGHFEDIGLLERKGILNIEMVYEGFGWYIQITYENSEIKKYIESEENEEHKDIYDNLKYIYSKCKKFGEKKQKKLD